MNNKTVSSHLARELPRALAGCAASSLRNDCAVRAVDDGQPLLVSARRRPAGKSERVSDASSGLVRPGGAPSDPSDAVRALVPLA